MPKRLPKKRVRRAVVFPRFTGFVGTTALYSAPVDVGRYSDGIFVAWRGTGIGSTPASVVFTVQQSTDLDVWVDGSTISPSADSESVLSLGLTYPWMRVKAVVSGSDPGVCGWVVVELVMREGSREGEAA